MQLDTRLFAHLVESSTSLPSVTLTKATMVLSLVGKAVINIVRLVLTSEGGFPLLA